MWGAVLIGLFNLRNNNNNNNNNKLAKIIHQKLAEVAELTGKKNPVIYVHTNQCNGE